MAQALGLPVRQLANGSLAITPALQVFVREALLRRNTL